VFLFGRHKEKLRIAKQAGVTTELAGKHLPESAFDWIVEATGSPDGLRQAVRMAHPRGAVFMKSTVHQPISIDTAPVIVNEISLIGSRCGRFEPALALLESGKVKVEAMIAETLPLEQAPKAFKHAAQRGALKVILNPR
jgi:alcohol dehydrogenase